MVSVIDLFILLAIWCTKGVNQTCYIDRYTCFRYCQVKDKHRSMERQHKIILIAAKIDELVYSAIGCFNNNIDINL